MFFATTNGVLVQYTPRSKTFSQKRIGKGEISDMLVSKTGNIYIAMPNQGLIIYDDQTATLQKKDNQATYLSIYEDRTGYIWLEPVICGVVFFKTLLLAFICIDIKKELNLPFTKRVIFINYRSINVFVDVNYIVWVCWKGEGFGYYKKDENQLC